MSLAAVATRLARLERSHAERDPAQGRRATMLHLMPDEPTAPQLAALADQGEHRRGWPVLAIRADWPMVRAIGGATA